MHPAHDRPASPAQPTGHTGESLPPEAATHVSLLNQLKTGGDAGWHRLLALYRPLTCFWVGQAGTPSQDYDDVCQAVLRVVFERIGEFERQPRVGAFRAWLRGTTVNVCRERNRRAGPERWATGGVDAARRMASLPAPADDTGSDPPELVADLYRRVIDLVRGGFSDRERRVFEEVIAGNRPCKDVAAEFGLTEANLRQIAFRIRKRIKTELGDCADQPI